MKNHIIKILTVIFSLTLCLGVFTACGGDAHVHDYTTLKYNAESHWKECSCGDKQTVEKHKGGVATATDKATCEVCNQEYGELLSENHVHDYTTLKYDAESHWKECSCGLKENVEGHKGGTATETQKAKCDVCNQEYGSLLIPGHTHEYTLLKYDENSHWNECSCGDKKNVEAHNGGTASETQKAKCKICNQEYGQLLEHTHRFTETITSSTYLKEKATCQSKALYFYSCLCGEQGENTFEFGGLGNHNLNDGKCSVCEEELFTTDGTYIYFGKYPRTLKASSVYITSSTPNENGYYLGSDGEEYAKFNARPYVVPWDAVDFTFNNGQVIVASTTYYFKVEPIRWRVLSKENGNVLLLCDETIDRYTFASRSNNYKDSYIREWINGEFYDLTFSQLERSIINEVLVDNSVSTTGYETNQYACENTLDKVFLLSYKDVTNPAYGFNDTTRKLLTTDYARARGANLYGYDKVGMYNGHWWTRSPIENYDGGVSIVNPNGKVGSCYCDFINGGVAVSIQINVGNVDLKTPSNDDNQNDLETEEPSYTRDGNYIYFGKYPKTVKADSVTVSNTANANGYYVGSDGCEYAKMVANPYSESSIPLTFTNSKTIVSGNTYYFKVEPIKWRILKENGSELTLICDMMLDAKRYDDNSNNYKDSEIRAWLNDEFYNKAFNSIQRAMVLSVTVDNSVESTSETENQYACDNTQDKIYLFSAYELLKYYDGFTTDTYDNRKRTVTDYARASGVRVNNSGQGEWWLRSPISVESYSVKYVDASGVLWSAPSNFISMVNQNKNGIVPAMQIQLS